MKRVVFCPVCALIREGDENTGICNGCENAKMVITDRPASELPELSFVKRDYWDYCRKMFETVIEPMGQLDKESLGYQRHYAEYYNVPMPPKYQAIADKRMAEAEERVRERDFYNKLADIEAQKPKCPTCGSKDIHSICGLERAGSVMMLGLFSNKINKSFKCNKCGYTW